jgi:hypothetical protein
VPRPSRHQVPTLTPHSSVPLGHASLTRPFPRCSLTVTSTVEFRGPTLVMHDEYSPVHALAEDGTCARPLQTLCRSRPSHFSPSINTQSTTPPAGQSATPSWHWPARLLPFGFRLSVCARLTARCLCVSVSVCGRVKSFVRLRGRGAEGKQGGRVWHGRGGGCDV